MSRDGGVNWFIIGKGSHIYEIGDQGGLIVMAEDQKASKYIYITWNQGLHWKKIKISEENVLITNIVIEKTNVGLKFLVYGISSQNGSYGFMVPLDFSRLMPRDCDHWDDPDKSDYEIWTPTNQDNKCLMGKKVSYLRRKASSECFNSDDLSLVNNPETCECTHDDYECDIGFTRDKDGNCFINQSKDLNFTPPKDCGSGKFLYSSIGYYTVRKGYRKVAGNECEGGLIYENFQLPCPTEGWKLLKYVGVGIGCFLVLVLIIKFELMLTVPRFL